ncbi:uncharacterized protein GGS22DRAFT_3968 [Annulohypoxylon maeteangense]|uniref:uncharacterized protein n=1 Tax=Annulohypoxylon maeteangense TaxID=1927788 RepID=UPI002007D40A|nr:uncharacterized protein GGS22DRAFT_3968 [Annulohypoxylon maeteangense]KAI0889774.1 hypothetical protein GGS22DRAFT_3968 [Annulohypoxylon maeteangense]
MAFERTRDLRGSAQDSKRFKDHVSKWRIGPWIDSDIVVDNPVTGQFHYVGYEGSGGKIRPTMPTSHTRRWHEQNVVKPRESRFESRTSAWCAKIDARAELNDPNNISRSLQDLLGPSPRRNLSISDNILYSFDRSESPYKPLTLDVFVKANPKETEKFVEKEYEILDNNGDALKGRKARQNLRRKNRAASAEDVDIVEDEGFELV